MSYLQNIWKKSLKSCLVIVLLCGLNTGAVYSQIAIIANVQNPVQELSKDELKAIFLGKQNYFEGSNDLILLCEYKPVLEDFCTKLYDFSAKKFNKHWFQLIFSGTTANPPKKLTNIENLLAFIENHESAIGYINLKDLPSDQTKVKILKIDGVSPASPNYILSNINLSDNRDMVRKVKME